jgi:hypothetical protein
LASYFANITVRLISWGRNSMLALRSWAKFARRATTKEERAVIELGNVQSFIALRIRQLADEESRLRSKLSLYRGFSDIAVLSGIIIPILAGSTLVTDGGILKDYKWLVAILVFAAAALTAVHKGLNCETYHAECRQAIHTLRSIIEGLEGIVTLEANQFQSAIGELEVRLQHYRERAFDAPPKLSTRPIDEFLHSDGKPPPQPQPTNRPDSSNTPS